MFVSKINVLVAHEHNINVEKLQDIITDALGQELQLSGAIFEVRDGGQHEVTLGSICYSLEEGAVLEHATPSDDKKPELAIVKS